ncbi:hypothetical protein IscW_ISCW001793 [Ixodes scapularis]|uniref:HEAT repeat-containing protein 1 n=1 Tax=Ixodes scapularis TaxID=6945 RepID=B7P140_IXOSC|nr:hypothetical protein IscW_ISCW001793 [Ixodes scapularis]|eukprot:XP_002400159.1 hypothetical protein IscW_ISCW001793 [Ixodes scapularis]
MAQQERYQSLVKFRQAVFSKDKIASESSQFHYSDVVKDDTQLSEFVELLVESVVQVKRNHPLVRSTGCNCLREIEFFFPGTIAKHLDELWGALAKDTSWASQALAQLVALALGTLVSFLLASLLPPLASLVQPIFC